MKSEAQKLFMRQSWVDIEERENEWRRMAQLLGSAEREPDCAKRGALCEAACDLEYKMRGHCELTNRVVTLIEREWLS